MKRSKWTPKDTLTATLSVIKDLTDRHPLLRVLEKVEQCREDSDCGVLDCAKEVILVLVDKTALQELRDAESIKYNLYSNDKQSKSDREAWLRRHGFMNGDET